MHQSKPVEDYEKDFLEKYFRKQAETKINNLNELLKAAKTDKEKEEIKNKIDLAKRELKRDLEIVEEEEERERHDFILKEKAEDIKYVPFDNTHFMSNFERALLDYKKKFNTDNPIEHLRSHGFVYHGMYIPYFIFNRLFKYQQDGLFWMIDLFNNQKGGVLSDEMGLGKTIQVIAFVSCLFINNNVTNILILCPTTVVTQWFLEFKRFYPFLPIYTNKYHDNRDGVYIMTYEMFRGLGQYGFSGVILDEGHKIKNKDTQITREVKKVETFLRMVVTGTPIQNNIRELWSIFDFVIPDLLGTHADFIEEFEKIINRGAFAHSTVEEIEQSYKYSVVLKSIIEPYILRRLKSQLKHELPGKIDKVVFVTLTPLQEKMYIDAIESDRIRKVLALHENTLCAIMFLRKICNHPMLMDSGCDIIESSAKMVVVKEFVDKWILEGRKMLIFSQSVKMIDIMENVLGQYKIAKMTGSTNRSLRQSIVDDFNNTDRYNIFLLTTRVGGLGLNLTSASRVIIYDPDWNPTSDNQAKERVYRYGQSSKVEIYRLVCKNTIEEKIYQKQIFKDCLSKNILQNPGFKKKFEKENIGDLFTYVSPFDKKHEISNDKNFIETKKEKKLVEINPEDQYEYEWMYKIQSKKRISGKELIEYIIRREGSLG